VARPQIRRRAWGVHSARASGRLPKAPVPDRFLSLGIVAQRTGKSKVAERRQRADASGDCAREPLGALELAAPQVRAGSAGPSEVPPGVPPAAWDEVISLPISAHKEAGISGRVTLERTVTQI
jgi:hypothetical protein